MTDTTLMIRELDGWVEDGSLVEAKQHKAHGASLLRAIRAVRGADREIERLVSLGRGMAGIPGWSDWDRTEIARPLVQLTRIATRLQAATTTEELHAVPVALEELTEVVEHLTDCLRKEWRGRHESAFLAHKSLGRIFEAISDEESGQEMVQAAEIGMKALYVFPPTEDSMASLESSLSTVEEQKRSLEGIGLTDTRARFLKCAVGGIATVADLDQDTLEWLRARNVAGRFAVRVKR